MPKCSTCSKALSGAWNLTGVGETGCYLGIADGYFLYSGQPNWVYCYCLDCWKKHVLALGFVTTEINKLKSEVSNLSSQITQKDTNISGMQAQISSKDTEISKLNQDLSTVPMVTEFLKSQSSFEKAQLENLNKEISVLKSLATELQTTKNALAKDASSVSSLTSELKSQVSRHEMSLKSDSKVTDQIGLDLVFYERVRRHLLCCQKDLKDFDVLGCLEDLHTKLKKAFSVCLETEWKSLKSNTQSAAKSLLECLEKEQKNLEQMLSLLESGLEANKSAVKPAEVQQMVDTTRTMKAHSAARIEGLKRLQVEAEEVTPILTT